MASYPTSQLSQENVLRDVHDPVTQTLRTSATALVPPGLEVEIDAAGGDNIAIKDVTGTNSMTVNADGTTETRRVNALITKPFDHITAGYPSSIVETYLYRIGGAGGTIVGLVTVTYTDATKSLIATVAKT